MASRQEEAELDEGLIGEAYDDIPEINLCINIHPYMYEPTFDNGDESRTSSKDSSDSDSHNVWDTQALPVDRWCSCDNCLKLPTAKECFCCHSMSEVRKEMNDGNFKCIIHHEGFIAKCLTHHVLKASFYEYIEYNGRPDEPVHEIYRNIAYRRFVRWIWVFGKKKLKNLAFMCRKCNKKSVSISTILCFPIPSIKMKNVIWRYFYIL